MVNRLHILLLILFCFTATGCGEAETRQSTPVGTWEGTFKLPSGNSGYIALSVQSDGIVYGFINNPDRPNSKNGEVTGVVSNGREFNANYKFDQIMIDMSVPHPKGTISGDLIRNSDTINLTATDVFDGVSLSYNCILNKTLVSHPNVSPLGKYVLKEFRHKNTLGTIFTNTTDPSMFGVAVITDTNFDNENGNGNIASDTAYAMYVSLNSSQTYTVIGNIFSDVFYTCTVSTTNTYTSNTITVNYQYSACTTPTAPEQYEVWIKLSDSTI